MKERLLLAQRDQERAAYEAKVAQEKEASARAAQAALDKAVAEAMEK